MPDEMIFARDFAERDPEGAARVLEEMAPTLASAFIDAIADVESSRLLGSMLPAHAAQCVAFLEPETAARYLAGLDPRSIASVLRCLDNDAAEAIVKQLPKAMAARTAMILRFPRSVVGAWVNPTVLVLSLDRTVGDAKARLKAEAKAEASRLFVVGSGQSLKGTVRIVDLVRADDETPLSRLVEPAATAMAATTSIDAALRDPAWETVDVLPVVERRSRFLGALRYADLRQAGQETTEETPAEDRDAVGSFMELAEYCYLGLAEVVNSSLAIDGAHQSSAEDRDEQSGR
ncbi:MAG: hypothetical protein VW405_09160 [Rhodospirillaceae bacterium]